MQLSPLQSRLAASLIASCVLVIIYILLVSPPLALAAELNQFANVPDAGPLIHEILGVEETTVETIDLRSPSYEPDFGLFDRSIIGRAPAGVQGLDNNVPFQNNINPGHTDPYVFEIATLQNRAEHDGLDSSEVPGSDDGDLEEDVDGEGAGVNIELFRRQSKNKTLWISANTCIQPERGSQVTADPPQLSLYVSTSSSNTSPGPLQSNSSQRVFAFNQGAVMFNMTLSGDVYFSISAPNITSSYQGIYNYEVAASVDQSYYTYNMSVDPNLVWVDSDANSTLLYSGNLTNATSPPYIMFAQNQNYYDISGLQYSYCGLTQHAMIRPAADGSHGMLTTDLTTRGEGGTWLRQEFYFSGLNASSNYIGIMATPGNTGAPSKRDNVPGGGGLVFGPTQFTTKATGVCQLVFNLTFCDQVAYAVPGNVTRYPNATSLASFYDDWVTNMWSNFTKVLAQIPCDTAPEAQYSLARNCTDCQNAYKDWICTVAIPRCEDYSNNASYLQPRNIMASFPDGQNVSESDRSQWGNLVAYNSSRNPDIDVSVQPGPYKEVLPCDDLCYTLVQSCPAAMQFGCPMPGTTGYSTSYASRQGSSDANVTCNYPGAAHYINSSPRIFMPWSLMLPVLGAAVALLW